MRIQSIIIYTLLLFTTIGGLRAQQLLNPFDFPILLSGNFGELRSNHFHAGIDFKTQGVEGKPIHAVAEGFVSRISVSPWGYGLALYLDHPDGTTTVYGHIQKFSDKIAAYVKDFQYERESFSVNILPSPDELPVEKGEVIALSGNTGGSAGPHLHFEVRNTETEEVMDPIEYYKDLVDDTKSPRIQAIMVYPMEGEGVVNGSNRKRELKVNTAKNGRPTLTGKVEAWGKIGLAVKAYDYMENTSNVYGVRNITLTADEQVIFQSDIDRYSFDETRYLNSFIDYEEWINNRSFYMKSFIEPGNRLRFLKGIDRGYLTIDEQRTYQLTYTLADAFGNTTTLTIPIIGKEQLIPAPSTEDAEPFHWNSDNRFGAKGVRLNILRGNLYADFYFRYSARKDSTCLSDIHQLHNRPLPLHKNAQLSIRILQDTLENKQQYGIVRIHKGRTSWIGGSYRNGWIDSDIRELGTYAIRQDTKEPVITPLNKETWGSRQRFMFRLTDNLSGVRSYRGEIDGQFVLFEMDNKSVISYRFDKERLSRGQHRLTLTVTDACGNQSTYTHTFTW